MSPTRYSYAAIALHWVIAFALAFQIALGWALDGPDTLELFSRYQLHKSVGITILVLSLLRLAIRFTAPRPAPSDGPAWTRMLASAVHALFYVVLIAGPLTGWILVSTARVQVPTLLWGAIPWPHLPVGRGWHDPAEAVHGLLAWVAIGLFLLHIAGALRHQWLLGKPELQRMIPFARGRAVPVAIGALLLISGAMALGGSIYPDRAAPDPSPARDRPVEPAPAETAAAAENTQMPASEAEAEAETEEEPVKAPEPLSPWAVEPGGRLGFTASWSGQAIEGRFENWRAEIRFSPDQLETSSIRATVDLASVGTGDGQRDSSLKGSDFFDTAAHPAAVFTANSFRRAGDDRYEARGTLDLRGVARPVTLRLRLRIKEDRAEVRGTARIDRTDFGVGQGQWASTDAIAGKVDIDFSFSARRRDAPAS